MTGSTVSLALGGGAAKGLAHVGVLRGLEDDGIEVTAIAGTSMGSIVGALYARGMSAAEMDAFFTAVDWSRLGWIMVRSVGGGAFRDLITETIGPGRIEDLPIPFAVACCDLDSGDEVVIREGKIADAVRASSAIPGLLPAVEIGQRTLVDGAMVTPVPVQAAVSLSDAPLVAVNVLRLAPTEQNARPVVHRLIQASAPARYLEQMNRLLQRHGIRLSGRRPDLLNRIDVVMRSSHIMQYNLSRSCDHDLLGIEPEVGHIGWFEFHRAREIIDAGYAAYRAHAQR